MPPKTRRGPSSRHYLTMEWEYPVYVEPGQETDGTVAKRKRQALSREDAVRYLAGDDPRPLLVLRECKWCNGTDDALLKGGIDNEQTFLLARWFHCVKLPVDVMEEDHPFHNMFTLEQPEHLFVCAVDGSKHDPLESQTSRTELWDSMRRLLREEYKGDPASARKRIASLLDKMDVADERLEALEARRDEILEEEGPDSKKVAKVSKRIGKARKECEALHAELRKASNLSLRRRKAPASAEESGE